MSKEITNGYCHITPGRMRVSITNLKNKPKAAKSLEVLLVSQPGIKHVKANSVTGKVLVEYDCKVLTYENVLESLEDLGHLPILSKKQPAPNQLDPAIYDLGMNVGRNLVKVALKQALRGSPAAIFLELI